MLRTIAVLALIAAAPAAASTPPPAETRVDVPQDRGPQRVVTVIREFAVGASSGWHRHPGVEIGQVLTGVTEMHLEGATRRYGAGETFVVPPDTAHNGINVGDVPARIAITYVIEKGAPVRSDVPDPHAGH